MKAMIIKSFGGPEVFAESDVQKPKPGPNELLVRVFATSINPVDYKIRKAGAWAGVNPPATIGYDISGMVEDIGPGVTDFKPGDEVYYTPEIKGGHGSYAEYHVVGEDIVALKPDNLLHIEAAAAPLAGCTAWQAMIGRGHLRVGQTVLIHGAAGGVGHFALQIAKAAGAYVFTTCGQYNFDFVKQLNADRPINYRAEDFVQIILDETSGQGVDLVLDTVGKDTVSRSLDIVKPFGRIVSTVNIEGDLNKAYRKNISIESFFLRRDRRSLEDLRVLIERNQIRPMLDSILPLEEVARGHQKLEQGGVRGKIVLKVSEE